jgi:hypothetical protein
VVNSCYASDVISRVHLVVLKYIFDSLNLMMQKIPFRFSQSMHKYLTFKEIGARYIGVQILFQV